MPKTIETYTFEEFEEKWPTQEYRVCGATTTLSRLQVSVRNWRTGEEAVADGGEWILNEIPIRSLAMARALAEIFPQIQKYIDENP